MFQHSKILVWYKIASQKVVLGEAHSDGTEDVVSLWLHAPTQFDNASNQPNSITPVTKAIGYRYLMMADAKSAISGYP